MTRISILAALLLLACKDDGPPIEKLPTPGHDEVRDRLRRPPPPPPPPRRRPPPPSLDPDADPGVIGGVVGGHGPVPPPPALVETIAPTALEATRISGDKNIVPDAATKAAISRSGKARVVVPVKVCLTVDGTVRSTTILRSSGFPAYDAKIEAEMRTWTYQPFMVNGEATPVCSAITLIYVQNS